MSQHTHADLWNKLVDEAGEDEVDRAASMSVEQAEAELKAAGFDVAEERAKANAFLDALEGTTRQPAKEPPAPAKTVARRPSRRPAAVWLAAAASIGAVAGGTLVSTFETVPLVAKPAPREPSAAERDAAAQLRRDAAAACNARQWSVCLAALEKARAFDPDGDDAPAVKSLRDQAVAAILESSQAPPR